MLCNTFPKEVHQLTVYFVRICPSYAVRPILHHEETGSLNQLGGALPRCTNRHNPVCIAVNDQRGYVDAFEVFAKILMPGWHTSKTRRGRSAGGSVPASLDNLFADALTQQKVRVVEILEEFSEERVTICDDRFLDAIEDSAIHALRVVRCLQQERRDCSYEYRLGHVFRSVFTQVACHFAPAHREANEREITQFEVCHELVQVLGEGVVVVTRCWLAGFAEPSAVIGDDAVPLSEKLWDLLLPRSTAQWIPVDQNYGVTRAVIFVVEIDLAGVFLTDINVWHCD